MLDPRFRDIPSSKDVNLAEEQFESAESFIKEYDFKGEWADSLQASWIRFRGKEGCFSDVHGTLNLFNISTGNCNE
jgi:hypothetical protein